MVGGQLAIATSQRPTPHPPDETAVFSGGEETRDGTRARAPAVGYWRVRSRVQVGAHDGPVHVGAFVPTGDGRQTILSRQSAAKGFALRDLLQPPNQRAEWSTERSSGTELLQDLVVRITAVQVPVPTLAVASLPHPDDPRALDSSPEIQSTQPEVQQRAHAIIGSATKLDEVLWALYEYVAAFQPADPTAAPPDALTTLTARRGNSLGRARALVALLRAVGVPARPVGGLRLAPEVSRRATYSWVEAWSGSDWIPLDPTGGHYAALPENYLALYHGDLPLIVHTAGIPFDYGFSIRETTRRAAEEDLLDVATDAPGAHAAFVTTPVGAVVILTDDEVPAAVQERILAEARAAAVDCVVLSAPFESRYLRQSHLERLLASHDGLVRRSHLIIVATADDVGALALLSLASRGVRLPDARIVVAGAMPAPSAALLSRLSYRVLHPGELLLVPQAANLLALWGMARANVLDGSPLHDEAVRWGLPGTVLGDPGTVTPRWRPRLVRAWEYLVRAQVPLAPITLILGLPIIATVVVAARILIGLQTFGNFGPIIIALAFVTTGLRWGTLLFITIVGGGVLLRAGLQRLRLQAVARLAILITLVAAVMAGLTFTGAALGNAPLLHVSIFPMLIMANVIENFAATQAELGLGQALRHTAGTLGLAITCYWLLDHTGLPALLLAMPELLLVAVAIDVALGRWRGVRLLEYVRFWRTLPT